MEDRFRTCVEDVRAASTSFVQAVEGGDEATIRAGADQLATAYRSCVEAAKARDGGASLASVPWFRRHVENPLIDGRRVPSKVAAYWTRECSKHCASSLEGILPSLDDVIGDMPFGLDMRVTLMRIACELPAKLDREQQALRNRLESRAANAGGGIGLVERVSIKARDLMLTRAANAIAAGSLDNSDHFPMAVLELIKSQVLGDGPIHGSLDQVNAYVLATNLASRFSEAARLASALRSDIAYTEARSREPEAPQASLARAL